MSGRTTPTRTTDRGESDTWPWQCLDCGTTIYHDGEFCRSCDSSHRAAETYDDVDASSGFVDWIREQTASGLVLRVTVVAGIELSLTAFWLQTLLYRSAELGGVVPIVP